MQNLPALELVTLDMQTELIGTRAAAKGYISTTEHHGQIYRAT